jgi:hypothetical protein
MIENVYGMIVLCSITSRTLCASRKPETALTTAGPAIRRSEDSMELLWSIRRNSTKPSKK